MACRFFVLVLLAALAASSCATSRSSAPDAPPPIASTEPAHASTEPVVASPESAVAARTPAPSNPASTTAAAADRIHFVVLHTNDVHGQVLPRKATWLDRDDPPLVGGLARAAACIQREKRAAEASGAHVLVLDGGDCYQGTPEGVIDGGLPFLRAMTATGYDAVCVGNHELDFGVPHLVTLLRESKLPSVLANVREQGTNERVAWSPPWRFVEKGGLRIALVGLLATETPAITHPDASSLVFVDPAAELVTARAEIAGRADWILPVTHLGVDDDRAVARAHPDLPLIVGGHSHTFLKEGVREGSTLIVQTGAKASTVGRVDVWFDARTKTVVESRARLIDLDHEPDAADRVALVDEICAELARRSSERMDEIVGELAGPLTRSKDPLASSSAGNFMADMVRRHGVADVGVMNRGGIRTNLDAGPITRRDAFELCPFENNLTVLTLTGAELLDMFTKSVEGTVHSGLEVSGVTVQASLDASGNRRLLGVLVGGVPVDPSRDYRVALNSFLADGGDRYVAVYPPGPKRKDDPILMRELIEETFVNQRPVVPNGENRYSVTRVP